MSRTLIELGSTESSVTLRTVSRAWRSPARFFLPRDELERLESWGNVTLRDMDSFADLYLRRDLGTLEIRLYWLTAGPGGALTGRAETVYLDYDSFHTFVLDSAHYQAETARLLSLNTDFLPVTDFSDPGAREVLRRVMADAVLRKKLIRALRQCFGWAGSRSIKFYPDAAPLSFRFEEALPQGGKGVCGRLIAPAGSGGYNVYFD